MSTREDIISGATPAYIDAAYPSNVAYKPTFVFNDHNCGTKVLATIEDELKNCDSFIFSVAFITLGGIEPMLQILQDLEAKNIPGKILTTDYNMFTDPRALDKLASLKNIELRMYREEAFDSLAYERDFLDPSELSDTQADTEKIGFHTKGYIFQKDETYTVLIGSSNMTGKALAVNKEWNTKFVSTAKGEMYREIQKEFYSLWNEPNHTKKYEDFIEDYRSKYDIIKNQRKITLEVAKQQALEGSENGASATPVISLDQYRLQPNSMQLAFIRNLKGLLEEGKQRALLISATGTGKTYASAFAMRELGFKKVLFLVHRGQLAVQTKKSYRRVFGRTVSMGLVGGGHQDYDADYVFATVQTLNRDEHLMKYEPDHFDAIIVDETHHVTADTYQKIMQHFTPKLWLGMTATPDKRDDHIEGKNVYEIFDHQIAYEIRLQQAMEEDLLCPFHYFGITHISLVDDDKEIDFSMLVCEERVRHIVEQISYYGYSGERVKGLIFCRNIEESRELSKRFNQTINPDTGKCYRTLALNGDANEQERQDAFERLAIDEDDQRVLDGEVTPLDYIFSVEILNEGVDIVEVNQVVMLRPTQSPIVFVQQLGRGLRKAEDKEFVVILDFIGNYNNNFMIPIALSGDRTYNKDNIRRFITEGSRVIPGASTVHFDEISQKKVFAALDNANFSDIKLIKENYTNLKNKLGRIPRLQDFDDYGEMDVLRIFDNQTLGSYYKFLVKHEKEYQIRLSDDEAQVIEFISKKLAAGKRIQELLMLKRMLEYAHRGAQMGLFAGLSEDMQDLGKEVNADQRANIVNMMTNTFPTSAGRKTYDKCVLIEQEDEDFKPSGSFLKMLGNPDFYEMVEELVAFGIQRHKRDYANTYDNTDFVLYQKYTYEDVCRLLNWEYNEVPLNIGGYKYNRKTKTFPVFINYDKDEDISDTIKYDDHFTGRDTLIAFSKSGRTVMSEDVQNFLKAEERGIQVDLFVRKNKDDKISKEFYYLGHMTASGRTQELILSNTDKTVVKIEWKLDESVREDIYQYILS